MEFIFSIALIGAVLAIYIFPSLIAFQTRNRSTPIIVIANLLTGWTIVGWLICMVWATRDTDPRS